MAHPGFCDFEGCSELASVDYYDCFMCRATMCPAHILKAAKDHPCPIVCNTPQVAQLILGSQGHEFEVMGHS